jgi:hypothetical protein
MAFNPFHTFRKNSKILMGGLTIFVMIIFVLNYGAGGGHDFFDWVSRLFGGSDSRGAVLATMEGVDVYGRELQEIRLKRAAANSYLQAAVSEADKRMFEQMVKEFQANSIKDPAANDLLKLFLYYHSPDIQQAIASGDQQAMFSILQRLGGFQNPFGQRLFSLMFELSTMRPEHPLNALDRLQQEASAYVQEHKDNEKSLDVRMIRQMAKYIGDEIQRAQTAESGIYLGTIPNKTEQDALYFRMYLDIADKMGIQLGDDAIQQLIRSETFGDLSAKDALEVDQKVRGKQFSNLSAEQLRQAVGDEFRVAMVKKIVGGGLFSGQVSIPAVLTPYAFFEFFKDKRTELTWEVIDVPVESFMDQVTDLPTDKEKRVFFDKYRNQEYDPSRESPGLKEPRKVKLQFITVDAKLPMYKNAQPALQAASTIAGGLTPSYLGGNALGGALEVATPLLAESLYLKEELNSKLEDKHREFRNLFGYAGDMFVRMKPRDSSVYHPLPDASLAAQLATMINPIAGLPSAIASYDNLVNLIETRDRVRFGMQQALAPYNPHFPLTAVGAAFANAPADPKSVYELQTAEEWKNVKRPEWLAQKDLESLVKKLTDLREKFRDDPKKRAPNEPLRIDQKLMEQANVEAYALIEQWLKDHPQAKTGKTALEDKYQLADDPVLKDAFAQLKDLPNMTDFAGALGRTFYTSPGKEPPEAGLYTPVITSRDDSSKPVDYSKPVYAAWKIEDQEAKAYKEIGDIPPEKLLRAWQMLKARELARKMAETVAQEATALAQTQLRDANNWPAFLRGLKDKLKALNPSDPTAPSRVIDLGEIIKVAPLEQRESLQPGRQEGYRLPQITSKEIKFKQPGMAEQLVELRDKPLGEAVVIPNVPKTHYYVPVLINKRIPTIEDFNRDVFQTMNPPPFKSAMRDRFYSDVAFRQALGNFSKDLMERLKAQTALKETEALKKQMEKSAETPE